MIERRTFVTLALANFILPYTRLHAEVTDVFNALLPPQEAGFADFSNSWERIDDGTVVASFASPDLSTTKTNRLLSIHCKSAEEINSVFSKFGYSTFVDWFNNTASSHRYWSGRKITGNSVETNFTLFWDTILTSNLKEISLIEFFTYMSVFINEIDGNLRHVPEKINSTRSRNNPGIAYLFNTVVFTTNKGTWRKQSYNKHPNNNCFDLLHNNDFLNAHSGKRFFNDLRNTHDDVWSGKVYPIQKYPVSPHPEETGIILECDFFKFRGRGLIQTTWRSNYSALVRFIQNYSGDSKVLKYYAKEWKDTPVDTALNVSSSEDWDIIFSDPKREVLTFAVLEHRRAGGYYIGNEVNVVNGEQPGSIDHFGDKLGGRGYGQRLKSRVFAMVENFDA
jgi:hypothetical protein